MFKSMHLKLLVKFVDCYQQVITYQVITLTTGGIEKSRKYLKENIPSYQVTTFFVNRSQVLFSSNQNKNNANNIHVQICKKNCER